MFNSKSGRGRQRLVGRRSVQRLQEEHDGLGVVVADAQIRHLGVRLHALRISDPAIHPVRVQAKTRAIQRRPDLSPALPDPVTGVASVLVVIELLATSSELGWLGGSYRHHGL